MEVNVKLRRACQEDKELLFQWANDPQVRQNAFHTALISLEEHSAWFEKMMADKTAYQFIAYDGSKPVGQVRLNVSEGMALIDYSVSPQNRKKGYGSRMLRLVEEQAASGQIPGVASLEGQVKYENTASVRVFEKCGYQKEEKPEYIAFTKRIDV